MSKKMLFYVGLAFIIANLFYHEFWGINTLIVAVCYVVISVVNEPRPIQKLHLKNPFWWISAILFISNGAAIYITHSLFSHFLYVANFLFFVSVHNANQSTYLIGFVQSIQSFFMGFFNFLDGIFNPKKQIKEGAKKDLLIKILLFTVPLIIAIIFLKLYQAADETFYEMTKFINLDWISWSFIGFYAVIYLTCFGLFFFHKNRAITKFDNDLKNNIATSYNDPIERYIGIANEKKIALSLLITLNVMLLLYNFIDLKFILIDLPNPSPELRYSELIHGGVNSLITSIVLVILIITFIYRGQLNFQGSKTVRALAVLWLVLNLVMVSTTIIKNYEYISHWGLTYKRIGVYIYLLLAATGLCFTIIKIIKVKSIWYLIRNTSLSFIICFSAMGFVNWNKTIAHYNLTQLEASQIDFDYLISLRGDTYPALIDYYVENKTTAHVRENHEMWHEFLLSYNGYKRILNTRHYKTTWRSYNLRDSELRASMNTHKVFPL